MIRAWRELRTRLLRFRRASDRVRWSNPASHRPEWKTRAELAAKLIAPGSRVLDLGCGKMRLGELLPDGCTYVPADLEPLSPGVQRVDLNRGEFPDDYYDYVVLLGVLGYLHEPVAVLRRAREHADRLIVSYKVAKKRDRETQRRRRRDGYFNDFDDRALADVFAQTGWEVESAQAYSDDERTRQDVFLCRAQAAPS
jgi:hypothetical protein